MGSGRGKSRRAQAKTSLSHLPVFSNVSNSKTGEPGVVFGAALDGQRIKYDVVWASGETSYEIPPEQLIADTENSSKPSTGADWLGRTVIFRDREDSMSDSGLKEFYGQRARVAKVRTAALSETLEGRHNTSELQYELIFSDDQPLRWLTRNDIDLLEDRIAERLQDVKVDTGERILF